METNKDLCAFQDKNPKLLYKDFSLEYRFIDSSRRWQKRQNKVKVILRLCLLLPASDLLLNKLGYKTQKALKTLF